MADDTTDIEMRQKTWHGFLRLMTLSGVAAAITLAILWATVV